MPRVHRLRETIRSQRREKERGPWATWLRDWVFWFVLNFAAPLVSWWGRDLFDYDPDAVNVN